MSNDLILTHSIMKSEAEEFKQRLWEYLETRTNDGFAYNSEQVEDIKDQVNYVLDLIDELECEDRVESEGE